MRGQPKIKTFYLCRMSFVPTRGRCSLQPAALQLRSGLMDQHLMPALAGSGMLKTIDRTVHKLGQGSVCFLNTYGTSAIMRTKSKSIVSTEAEY
jgi:hypothetical protein